MCNTIENSEVIKFNRKFEDSKEKRKYLRKLSQSAKAILESGETEAETVNEVLVGFYRDQEGEDVDFNTFKGWKKQGLLVKKGEVSFLVWGKPRKIKDKEAAEEEEKEGTSFFPVAHIFCSNQVERKEAEHVPA